MKLSTEGLEEEYRAIWEIYPRHISRKPGLKAYIARRNEGIPAEDLLKATKTYANVCEREGRETVYILHPSTFFGPYERFRDFLPAEGDAALAWQQFEQQGSWIDPWDNRRYSVPPDERGFPRP